MHSRDPGYQPGNYWLECDECGFDYRRDRMRQRWDRAWVCSKCWEPRHPQDLLQAKEDAQAVDPARPPKIRFISPGDVTQDDL